jgi:multidrug efflux pump subunit AcrA (membrane-fusion protein)
MSERVLSQCVNVSKSIDRLEEETAELIHQKELQEARAEAERRLAKLLLQQTEKLEEIQDLINSRMVAINDVVTERQETAPLLQITPQKEIIFETPGNTSEGTAFKSLVVYDLSILELCPTPALIHDSNILKRIEDTHLEHILERYQDSGRQIFIAFDKADSTTEKAYKILEDTAILRLSDGNELFGRSWSKYEVND